MTYVRASHLRLVVNEPTPVTVRQPRLRFQPVVRPADGAAVSMHAEADIAFGRHFSPAICQMRPILQPPAGWAT